ncbi:hypothetical protein GCM10010976_28820 [Bizionia arctica]|uniref:Fibronectin type-III domain-containing protein n=2 Tax=Bizionia arctica TaxID=1495645 RepID=A0A917GT04_9FLAO|nr:hypothetical protein GCM10010976_28820 [Bizionia arctica]
MTQVFSGTVPANPLAGWMEITLDTPFNYNNIDNLVVAVDENATGYNGNGNAFRIFTPSTPSPTTNSGIYYQSDSTNPNPTSITLAGVRTSYRNQIQLEFTSTTPCSGTPNGGNVTVAPISGNPGSTYGVNATDYTVGTGLTYQWQHSDTGGTPWTNQGTANTSYTALTGLTAPALGVVRTWRLRVTCTASVSSGSSSLGTFTSAITYCTPTNTYSTSYYISGVTTTGGVTNISNTGTGFSGYTDYSALFVSQYPGSNFSLTATHPSSTYGYNVWIDWNNDGDFNDVGENVISTGYLATPATLGDVTIPGGQTPGNYRMRIRNAFLSNPAPACGSFDYGEAEDYTVTVLTLAVCSGTPTGGTVTVNPTSGNPGSTYGVTATGYTIGTGLTYQWQHSDTGGAPWTNQGTTTASYVALTGLTAPALGIVRTWRLIVTCTASVSSGNSSTGTFTSVISYCTPTNTYSTSYYISGVTTTGGVANINNTGTGFSGYTDYSTLFVSQYPGSNFTLTATHPSSTYGYNVWVDWNDDGDFDDPAENVISTGYLATPAALGTVTIPGGQTPGNYRMRIRNAYLSNPAPACGEFDYGEAEDYTITILTPTCVDAPSNIVFLAITETSSVLSWTAASPTPANGYSYYVSENPTAPNFSALPIAPGGSTSGTSVTLSPLTSNTAYYVWVRSECGGLNGQGTWIGPESFTTDPELPVTTGLTICVGDTGTISATAPCTVNTIIDNTIDGNLDGATGGIAIQPEIFITNPDNCDFDDDGNTANYTTINFQVSISGTYTFSSDAPDFDIMGYIIIDPNGLFNAGTCAGEGTNWTWITGDDDSGVGVEAILTANLTAGITYTLITTAFSFSSVLETESYSWNITGPGVLSSESSGEIEWYDIATGGTSIGTGTPFNPIGTTLLPDTSTPGTYTFYAACSAVPSYRTPVEVIINDLPTASISGDGSICADPNVEITIALTGTQPWNVTYTNGTTPITISGITSSPHIFTVSPIIATTYTLTAVNDMNCNANIAGLTGTAIITAEKTWTGNIDTNWYNDNNWYPVGKPDNNDCVVIPDVSSGSNNSPEIDFIDSSTIPFPPVPGYTRKLTINSSSTLEILAGSYLVVTDEIDLNGTLNIQDTGSLIQVTDGAVNTNNNTGNGVMNMQRTVPGVNSYDYVYWSSPTDNDFNVTNISSATGELIYEWNPTLNGVTHGDWIPASGIMTRGKGYIVRGLVSTNPVPPNTAHFTGKPQNGLIETPITRGTYVAGDYDGPGNTQATALDDNWNLIGNPYPSAISYSSFIAANPYIDGAIYLWTHQAAPSAIDSPFYYDFVYNYGDDYIDNNYTGSNPPGFNGDIAAGQAFFVLMLDSPIAAVSENIVFNNTMRNQTLDNGQFYKLNEANENFTEIERHRIWLDLITPNEIATSILVGYIEGATNNKDRLFDGHEFAGSSVSFYSLIGEEKMAIQGKALPFIETDLVSLGLLIPQPGNYTIAINTLDGLFETGAQDIYLEDTFTGIIHDLRVNPYSFNAEVGTFNDRFVLRYTNDVLSNEEFNIIKDLSITAPKNDYIKITSTKDVIKDIVVYDLLGKVIFDTKNILKSEVIINDLKNASGTFIVKVTLANGLQKTQKVVLKK